MRRRLLICALAAASCAAPVASAQSPGAQSLGDPLFPQIGNGGYDARHYDIDLRYDPEANRLLAGTSALMVARSSKDLSRFSLDFQRDLAVTAVSVDGQPATFERRDAKKRLSRNRKVTQPAKLIVTPAAPIPRETGFSVTVSYEGVPRPIVDADLSSEGWVRACSSPGNCDGSFTVNEPIGTQSWLPSNNHPSDKATVDTTITAPSSHVALGVGELASRTDNPDGTTTWAWVEDDRTATFLLSATVGRFDLTETTAEGLPVLGAIDSAASPSHRKAVLRSAKAIPAMLRFLDQRFGPYPFDSAGWVADWVSAIGYALENQTKPHFPGVQKGPTMPEVILAHEFAHQWMGDSVTPRDWGEIWFSEGWAYLVETMWSVRTGGQASPGRLLRQVLASKASKFRLAPAELEDPADLFDSFAVYGRPAAMLEGYRRIVGERSFRDFARRISGKYQHATIDERLFTKQARLASGFGGRRARRLREYFDQWLHRPAKPTLTPADFR